MISNRPPGGIPYEESSGAQCLSTPDNAVQPLLANEAAANSAPLARRAAAGDERAFEALYRACVGRVYALCLRMTADADRARELTQDVFVRAWERMASFRGESAFESWLHRLAVNVVLESERSTSRRLARVEPREDLVEVEREGRSGSMDDRMDIEAAIAALPAKTRCVFVLHDIEGYRHEEISRLTGAAEGTIRAQLFRARRMLMEALSR